MALNSFFVGQLLKLISRASAPSSPVDGEVYYDSTLGFQFRQSGAWKSLGSTTNPNQYTATAGETLAAGDAIYVCYTTSDSSRTVGRVYKLDVTSAYRWRYAGIATAAASSGTSVTIQVASELVLSAFSGVGAGNQIWASITTPGSFQSSAPSSSNLILPLGLGSPNTNGLLINSSLCALQSGTVPVFIAATGGTITTDGNFKVHTFTSSGTFQITAGSGLVDSLVVAGGGGGAGAGGGCGGGGAGGLIYTTGDSLGIGSYSVTVGTGGAGSSTASNGVSGNNSVFNGHTAIGGGGGGAAANNGSNGGSGGGGGRSGSGGTGTVGQGHNGGNGLNGATYNNGGGGGGSSSAGSNAPSDGVGGNGGNGTANSITGSSVTYAGGGGGGIDGAGGGTAGSGGSGGGGAGAIQPNNGSNGTANTGGGGGGGSQGGTSGGNGGSGIVIVRYQFQ